MSANRRLHDALTMWLQVVPLRLRQSALLVAIYAVAMVALMHWMPTKEPSCCPTNVVGNSLPLMALVFSGFTVLLFAGWFLFFKRTKLHWLR